MVVIAVAVILVLVDILSLHWYGRGPSLKQKGSLPELPKVRAQNKKYMNQLKGGGRFEQKARNNKNRTSTINYISKLKGQ